MRYYISDLHFGHDSLNHRMDNRGFASAEEMDEFMISRWNETVRPNDEVVILGDFSIAKNRKEPERILGLLNGKKCLITGNHDMFLEDKRFDRTLFEWIEPYKELHDNKRKVILSHYPVFCYNGQYRRSKEGEPLVYMLYGHVHNSYDELLVNTFIRRTLECRREVWGYDEPMPIPCQMINCFCMFSDYRPLTLDEWIETDRKRRELLSCIQ